MLQLQFYFVNYKFIANFLCGQNIYQMKTFTGYEIIECKLFD